MISSTPGNDQIGHVRLEPLGPNRTMFHFDERYNLQKAPFKWFEGPIYKFINKNNEDSHAASLRLADRAPRVPGRPHRSHLGSGPQQPTTHQAGPPTRARRSGMARGRHRGRR